jgi:acid phosphatase
MVLRPHVMVLMMENQSFSDIIANPSAPYQNQLARSYKTATNYYGVGHYSLDNYLAAITGNFYAWSTGDCSPGPGCQSSDATLANQLDAAGIPWDAYMGSMPTDCDTSNYDNGTVGHSYGVRHNPFVYFPDLVKTDCARDQPSANMLGALDAANPPDFVWYSPQICDDGGGDDACATIAAGDRFLSREIPAIERTPWYKHGGVVVLTYDEGDSMGQGQGEHLTGEGNHLLTVVISAATAGKPDYTAYVNHFGLLASIEKAFGLGCMNQACTASNGHLALS